MPTVTIPRAVDPKEAAETLRRQLGDRYTVDSHPAGAHTAIRVKHGGVAFANIRMSGDGAATTFRVHGGGLIVGRIANEFGIARTVATAIKDAYLPADSS